MSWKIFSEALYVDFEVTTPNALYMYTGLNAQKLKVDDWAVSRKSPGASILRAPVVLIM